MHDDPYAVLRAELSEKLTQIGTGAVEVLAGAICLLAALLVLLQALVIALANAGMGAGWASLLVGLVVAGFGLILLRSGSAQLRPSELAPDRTQGQLASDARVVKEQMK